jgi:hypothetical protein
LKREFVFTCPQLHSNCPFVATEVATPNPATEVAAPILSATAPSSAAPSFGATTLVAESGGAVRPGDFSRPLLPNPVR